MRPASFLRALVITASVWLVGGPAAQAQTFTYEWNYQGAFIPNSGTITVTGSTSFTMDVYIRETSATTVLSTARLFGAGVRASYNSPGGVISVPNTASIARNPQFNDAAAFTPTVNAANNFAQFTEAVVNPVTDLVSSDVNKRIFLGSFTFQAANVGTTTNTALTALDIPGTQDTITGLGQSIDSLIAPTTITVSVVPVPEPAGLLVLAGAAGGLAALRRRSLSRS
jgi:hypothetical protein